MPQKSEKIAEEGPKLEKSSEKKASKPGFKKPNTDKLKKNNENTAAKPST